MRCDSGNRGGRAFVRKQLHHVEEIAGMLPVHGGDELSAIHVFQ